MCSWIKDIRSSISNNSLSVWGRVEWVHLNTANTITIGNSNLNVAQITPGSVPRVLNEPVLETRGGIGTIANGEDSVVQVSAAVSVVKDATLIEGESMWVGLDRDSERLLRQRSLHLNWVWVGNLCEGAHSDSRCGSLLVRAGVSMLLHSWNVCVDGLSFGIETSFIVCVCILLETTIAAFVAISLIGTINELLLGEI